MAEGHDSDYVDYLYEMREATAEALRRIGGMTVIARMSATVESIGNAPSGYGGTLYGTSLCPHGFQSVVTKAIWVLSELGGAQALVPLLNVKSSGVREEVINGLRQIGHKVDK